MGNLDARLLRFRNDPGSEPAVGLAAALLDEGREREAAEVAETAIARTPRDPELGLLLGRSLILTGDMLRAQQALLAAARVAPKDPRPFRWLGEVLLRRGDPARAKKVLAKARALGGGDDDAIRRLLERATRFERIADQAEDDEITRVAPAPSRPPAAPKPVVLPKPPKPVVVPKPPRPVAPPNPIAPPKPVTTPQPAVASGRPGFEDDVEESTVVANDLSLALAEAERERGVEPATSGVRGGSPAPFDPPTSHTSPVGFDTPTAKRPSLPDAGAPTAPPSDGLPPSPLSSSTEIPLPETDDLPPWEGQTSGDPVPPPEPTPDLSLGERAGQAEDVDAVLDMLRSERLFEQPEGEAGSWASAKESRAPKTKTLGLHIVTWVLAVGVVAGAWFGYQWWTGRQEREAAQLAESAAESARRGDHADLVDAERNLRHARELHPLQAEGPRVLLFVHGQRALEDGSFEPGYLRPSLDLADRVGLDSPRVKATRAVLAYAEDDPETGAEALEAAREAAGDDAEALYLIGRLEQRLGDQRAVEHLQAATEKAPELAAAHLALAEEAAESGRPEEAEQHIAAVLERHQDHLRATLWQHYLAADDGDPDAILGQLESSAERLEAGAATDRVLHQLTRARLLRRKGELAGAEAAVELAAQAGATEPRLQALVASAAFALGQLPRAQQAATAAVSAAPSIPDYRKLLAEIMVARRDGVGALRVLAPLSSDDPDVLRASARAALLVGSEESLGATVEALEAFAEAQEEPSVEMRALLLRAKAQTGAGRGLLREARRLAQGAPGDPDAGLALAEVALAEDEVATAIEALERVTAAAPRGPDGHFLLGRARRMAGQADEAEASFRRALELQPGFTDAKVQLGYLLLDRGQLEEAETLYAELATTAPGRGMGLVARLGRVEALLGLGRTADAEVQLEGLRDEERELPSVRLAQGRLALAKGEPGEAVQVLRSLAEGEGATTDIRALYGDALRLAGEREAAIEVYESVLEGDDGHPEALLGLAEAQLRTGNARDAKRALERAEASLAQRIRPPAMRARALTLKGRIALGERDPRGAAEALRAATEVDAAPAEAHFYLGEALAGRDSPAARAAYEKYLELAPEGPLASRARRALP